MIPIQSRFVVQLLAFYFLFLLSMMSYLLWLCDLLRLELCAIYYGVLEYPSFQILLLVDNVLGFDFSDWF